MLTVALVPIFYFNFTCGFFQNLRNEVIREFEIYDDFLFVHCRSLLDGAKPTEKCFGTNG